VTPKVQVFSSAETSVAIGALHFANFGDQSLGVGYGVVTHGSADSAVTAGFGYGYVTGEDRGGAPMIMVGGEHRVARRVKLVTENYAFRGGGFLSGGVRLLGERMTVDFALVAPLNAEQFVAFPLVNFVWSF